MLLLKKENQILVNSQSSLKMMNRLLTNLKKYDHRKCFNNMSYSDCYEQVIFRMGVLRKLYNNVSQVKLHGFNNEETIIDLLGLLLLGKQVVIFNPNATSQELSAQTRVLKNNQNSGRNRVDECGIVLFTSGSSGTPKTVLLTKEMIEQHVITSQLALGYSKEDCWLLTLPIFHVGGLMILFRSIYNGTSFHLLPKFSSETVSKLINDGTVNMASLVPTMMTRLLPLKNTHRLRVLLLGGETISDALVKACLVNKLPIFKTYGMTETCSQVCTLNLMTEDSKRHTVGKPLEGFQLSIINQDSQGIGEIIISGPAVFEGYLNNYKPVTAHETGDLGKLDKAGYLSVYGRKDDMLIIGGENVFPQEVEQAIASIQKVEQCAVIGLTEAEKGSELIAFVSGDIIVADVLKHLQNKLSKYKIPKKCYKLKRFPQTASGKLDKKNLMMRLKDED